MAEPAADDRLVANEEPPVLDPGADVAPGYTVVDHLSRGDALDVYEVFSDELLCSCVAKLVRPDRLHTQRVRDRLLHEGRLLMQLVHPHLLRGLAVIESPQPVVIVETLPGLSLEELIEMRSRRLPVPDLCHLGRQLCSAVDSIHRAGYLHLDLRPANVLASSGIAKVIDLSLARPPGRVNRGMGSREYLSPEQATGGTASTSTDVWGIGATLYEATTAVPPFAPLDEQEGQVVDRGGYLQLRRPALPLARWRRGLPASFADAIEACLSEDPARRPTVRGLWTALGSVLESRESKQLG